MNTQTLNPWPTGLARRLVRRLVRSLAGLLVASAGLLALPASAAPDAPAAAQAPSATAPDGATATATPSAAPTAADTAFDTAMAAAKRVSRAGPQDIPLAAQGQLKLPAGLRYVPEPEATQLLNAMGNPGRDPQQLGLVFPDGGGWFAILRFEPAGYIKDDDARDWDTAALLKSFQDGTAAANEERLKMGAPAIEVLGWAEAPAYRADSHRLVWAMSSRHVGAPADAPQGVNYNTYVLGREGYLSLNLVTGLKDLPAHKPQALALLENLSFDAGKRYADFDSKTDKVAEYGLAALVVGVAAKKLGLLAVVLGFGAKFAKVILLGLALVGGGLARFVKRKPKTPQ